VKCPPGEVTAVTSEPFVCVVTPFFNTEAYLSECIESVLAQTYPRFEYVLVDNQSTDGSADIAAGYAKRDSRIRLVRTPRFLTQVQNYNFALDRMSPEARYCKVVQADDWLFRRCLEEMAPVADAHPTVAMVGSYRLVEAAVDCAGLHPHRSVISGRQACRLHLRGEAFLFGSPTTVLYRADVVRARKPFFAEGRLHEDTEAAFEILVDRDFGFVHQVLSFSRRQAGSSMVDAGDFLRDKLDLYIVTTRYAGLYLEAEERDKYLRDARARYYSDLARQWLSERVRRPNEKFWDYQKRGLSTIGERIRPALIAKHAAALVVRRTLSPLDLARAAKRAPPRPGDA
jgi:glycosyltransferase involved in cell wall biosynthesis